MYISSVQSLFHGDKVCKCLTSHVLVLVAQSCPTLRDSMDWSLPGFSVHGILQARLLEWGAISFSRGSFQPRDRNTASRFFTT